MIRVSQPTSPFIAIVFKKNCWSTYLGILLLLAFYVQHFLDLKFSALETWQQQESYKRWSGLAMALLFCFQWLLTGSRVVKRFQRHSHVMAAIHKWVGAISPLFFYAHSTGMGYGYLFLLSYVFFSNSLIGYMNPDYIRNNSMWFFNGWMIAHVACSLLLTLLVVFHIGVVFYYK